MPDISYFQKYSQKENHITNNTMLMLRHVYRHSPIMFGKLVEQLIEDSKIEIGLTFSQQLRSEGSTPDALISQKPVNIYIEAKSDGELYLDQIKRHAKSIKNNNNGSFTSVIVGLSKKSVSKKNLVEFQKACEEHGASFTAVTYRDIVESLNDICPEYESDLKEIIIDYESFIRSQGMLPNPFEIVVFPCGTSSKENIEFSLYYEPPSRPLKTHVKYIGLYKNKKISHMGEIKACVVCKNENGVLVCNKDEFGQSSANDKLLIQQAIKETSYYDLGADFHRYYLIENLQEVNIEKKTAGGIRGHRYLDLNMLSGGILDETDSVEIIASKLQGKQFS